MALAPAGANVSEAEQSHGCTLPNMADVLKGLGKVKLRSVERYVGHYGSSFVLACAAATRKRERDIQGLGERSRVM